MGSGIQSWPFLFNLFYEDLIAQLNEEQCGITINKRNYNVYCYADDILLASTTPTGLQHLVDIAVEYATTHGLRFNPSKTVCSTFGQSRLTETPALTIEGEEVRWTDDGIKYLGAQLHRGIGLLHVEQRIKAAQKAFYSLQGAGLCYGGVKPDVATHLFLVGVRTVLTYGCEAIHLSPSCIKKMESAQGKLVKAFLGLRKWSHSSPLLRALSIPSISQTLAHRSLSLLRSNLVHSSHAAGFYCYLLQSTSVNTLVNRAHTVMQNHNINFFYFVLNSAYCKSVKSMLFFREDNGIVDSIRTLLSDYNELTRDVVQMLVNPF